MYKYFIKNTLKPGPFSLCKMCFPLLLGWNMTCRCSWQVLLDSPFRSVQMSEERYFWCFRSHCSTRSNQRQHKNRHSQAWFSICFDMEKWEKNRKRIQHESETQKCHELRLQDKAFSQTSIFQISVSSRLLIKENQPADNIRWKAKSKENK